MLEIVKEPLGYPLPEMQVTNLEDVTFANAGQITQDKVRSITTSDWQIDRSITTLALPPSAMESLGIFRYGLVRLRIQDTDMSMEVEEVPKDTPALVGNIPLEMFDLRLHSKG